MKEMPRTEFKKNEISAGAYLYLMAFIKESLIIKKDETAAGYFKYCQDNDYESVKNKIRFLKKKKEKFMCNKFQQINNRLFEQMDKLCESELSGEELDNELKKATAISNIAETIIKNADLQFKTAKLLIDSGSVQPQAINKMLCLTTEAGK